MYEFPFELDEFQKRSLYRLEQHQNVLVCAHTSSGKTVVAEYGIALGKDEVIFEIANVLLDQHYTVKVDGNEYEYKTKVDVIPLHNKKLKGVNFLDLTPVSLTIIVLKE